MLTKATPVRFHRDYGKELNFTLNSPAQSLRQQRCRLVARLMVDITVVSSRASMLLLEEPPKLLIRQEMCGHHCQPSGQRPDGRGAKAYIYRHLSLILAAL